MQPQTEPTGSAQRLESAKQTLNSSFEQSSQNNSSHTHFKKAQVVYLQNPAPSDKLARGRKSVVSKRAVFGDFKPLIQKRDQREDFLLLKNQKVHMTTKGKSGLPELQLRRSLIDKISKDHQYLQQQSEQFRRNHAQSVLSLNDDLQQNSIFKKSESSFANGTHFSAIRNSLQGHEIQNFKTLEDHGEGRKKHFVSLSQQKLMLKNLREQSKVFELPSAEPDGGLNDSLFQ